MLSKVYVIMSHVLANATLDLDGTDAACKLVIIMNTVLNGSAVVALDDVGRTGVDDIGLDDFNRLSQDVTIKLVASATYSSAVNKYILTVKPTQVDKSTLIGKILLFECMPLHLVS